MELAETEPVYGQKIINLKSFNIESTDDYNNAYAEEEVKMPS